MQILARIDEDYNKNVIISQNSMKQYEPSPLSNIIMLSPLSNWIAISEHQIKVDQSPSDPT
jgi:hypothetical protein